MSKNGITYQQVWDKLSLINVSDNIKKKNNLIYLSWAWAWQVMMESYPEVEYEFEPEQYHTDHTCTVHCTVSIGKLSRSMWLPVMTGFKNTAVPNPSARDIGDAKMRCLTKAFAMFGLAHYIYAGEDLPSSNERNRPGNLKTKEEQEDQEEIMPRSKARANAKEKEKEGIEEPENVHEAVENTMIVFIEGLSTIEELKFFWRDSIDALKAMEKEDTERYKNILKLFKEKKESF